MPTGTVMWLVVVIGLMAVVPALCFYGVRRRGRRHRERLGPAHRRALAAARDRRAAEREARDRLTRSGRLDVRPLDPESRRGYAERWRAVQDRFPHEPSPAVREADLLVRAVMTRRGYVLEDFAQRVSALSVRHSGALGHYRQAHEISGRATGRWVSMRNCGTP